MRWNRKKKEKTQGMDLEQFRNMTWKAKIQWLVQYYGVTAVVCIIFLGVVINLLHSFLFPAPAPDRHIVILADEISTSEVEMYQTQLTELTGQEVLVENFFVSDVYGQMSFSAVMGLGEVDLVIAPEEEMLAMEDAEAIRERRKIELGDLSIAVTVYAAQDEILDTMLTYFEEIF